MPGLCFDGQSEEIGAHWRENGSLHNESLQVTHPLLRDNQSGKRDEKLMKLHTRTSLGKIDALPMRKSGTLNKPNPKSPRSGAVCRGEQNIRESQGQEGPRSSQKSRSQEKNSETY